jgi:hypothetical protein
MAIAIQSSAIHPMTTAMPIFSGDSGNTMHRGINESEASSQERRCSVADVPNTGASELLLNNAIAMNEMSSFDCLFQEGQLMMGNASLW